MGEAETKKSRGVSLTLHSWMGEPSDQDEDEKTLELSLGLPGGGGGQAGWRTASKHKGRRSTDADTSMLSLGYSAAPLSPRSQGTYGRMDAVVSG
jgi:auxin-responsive protein IAA